MKSLQILNKDQFDKLYSFLEIKNKNKIYLYELYCIAMENAENLINSNILNKVVPVNSPSLILYIIFEYNFYIKTHNLTEDNVLEDENATSVIISISLDKYFTNEHLQFKNKAKISKYSPQISTLNIYLNFILGTLNKYQLKDPNKTLVVDIMNKGFLMTKAIVNLIIDGFDTEAFSTWRTLHETECILKLLMENDNEVSKEYLKHMDYARAFRGHYGSKEETDELFIEIKEGLKSHLLKSKDMKKFIEYGWLFSITKNNEVKLNFRDGVENLAGLSQYSKVYEMASEIAHSSPLLIYGASNNIFYITLMNLYESFFRLEKLFYFYYQNKVSKEEFSRYLMLRNVYYKQLNKIYEYEKENFSNFLKKKNTN